MLLEMSNMLQVHLQPVKEQLDRVETRIESLEERMKKVETELGDLRLTTEIYVLPLLGELKSCYTGAYERYFKAADRIEIISQDVDILKQVVSKHSRKLESLS